MRTLQSLGQRCGNVLLLIIIGGCQDNDPTAPTVPIPASPSELSGTWTLSDSTLATTPTDQTACRNRGVATFTAGTAITGAEVRLVGTCLTSRGPGSYTITMEGSPVKISGDSITFEVGRLIGLVETCTYRGRLTGGPLLAASGSVTCSRRGTGSWEMSWGLPRPPQLGKFTSIDIGFGQTCALDTNGQAWCWGVNSYGHLGIDDDRARLVPTPVSGNQRFTTLAVAREGPVNCGLTATGEAWCWGSSWGGVLGDGSGAEGGKPVSTPQRVVGGHSFSQIAPAASHTCAITTAGVAYCWGTNSYGQLGTGNQTPSSTPVAVSGNLVFRQIASYTVNTCGVTTAGRAYCWGEGWSGILGNGETKNSNVPVPVSGNLSFASVSVGLWMACGVTTDGDGYCWGDGGSGLGTGSDVGWSSTPLPLAGGLKWKSIRAGGYIACGVTTASGGYCWGEFIGGTNGPAAIAGSLLFDQVVVDWHRCALTVAGAAWCWGMGDHGQIGDGNLRSRSVPVKVAGQQ